MLSKCLLLVLHWFRILKKEPVFDKGNQGYMTLSKMQEEEKTPETWWDGRRAQ